MTTDVLIIGGGLAGLSCANTLSQSGVSNLIVEADNDVGGRARTDNIDGFLLDRGFQVFSTAYPEAKRALDYAALKLHKFYSGALIRFNGKFHCVSDPFRHPFHAIPSLFNPIGTIIDKFRVASWRSHVLSGLPQDIFKRPETSTLDHLQSMGFSQKILDRFFRPFLGGVFLDQELTTSSRMADFVFRMFASGDIALPESGIGALSQQLARNLQPEQIRTGAKVVKVAGATVTLQSGESLGAKRIVIATEECAAATFAHYISLRPSRQTTCVYFTADEPPLQGPFLHLNGERTGVINSACVLTEVCPSYAPPGKHLISVTIREKATHVQGNIEDAVRSQCIEWYGTLVKNWQHLRTYRLPQAQPNQSPPFSLAPQTSSRVSEGQYICGDHCSTATFDGAIGSGRRAAEEIISELKAKG